MPTPNSKTNLVFTSRKLGMQLRLVVQGNNIEIYQVDDGTGLETFKCLLDNFAPYEIFLESCNHIKQIIKKSPLTLESFNWLNALHYYGLLEI